MRISDWSSDVCSSDLETADRWSLLAPRFGELFDELETISQLKEALLKLSITGLFDQVAGIEGKRAEETPIGEIVSVVGGSTPSKQQSDYWGGDIPWISPKDMKVAEINDAVDHVTEKAVASTNIKLRSEEHTSELQSLMRISYAVYCLKK